MLYGYARVSSRDQNADLQIKALKSAECEQIFVDKASGKNIDRKEFKRLRKRIKKGDTLVVWKLDRLGRSTKDLVTLLAELQSNDISFKSLTDAIDTSTAFGRFFFVVMSAFAEMERELIYERTMAGLAAAREEGRIGGRPRKMTDGVIERMGNSLKTGATRRDLALAFDVSEKTVYKYFPIHNEI